MIYKPPLFSQYPAHFAQYLGRTARVSIHF